MFVLYYINEKLINFGKIYRLLIDDKNPHGR